MGTRGRAFDRAGPGGKDGAADWWLGVAGDMFRAPDSEGGRAGPRAAKPPGGEPGDRPEEAAPPRRPDRMASNIFGPTEAPQNIPKRTNPPGGKGSGIFDESGPVQTRPRLNPPGGKTSDIFGSPVAAASPTAHPNKPKDHMLLCEGEDTPDLRASASPRQEPGEPSGPREAAHVQEPAPTVDSHEPRLGPRPRSHNKVLNPPGVMWTAPFTSDTSCQQDHYLLQDFKTTQTYPENDLWIPYWMVKKTLTCCWPSGLRPYCQLHEGKSFLNRSPGGDFGAELGTKAEWGLEEEITTRAEPNTAGPRCLTLILFPSSFPSLGPWAWVEGAGMVWSWEEPQKTLLL